MECLVGLDLVSVQPRLDRGVHSKHSAPVEEFFLDGGVKAIRYCMSQG